MRCEIVQLMCYAPETNKQTVWQTRVSLQPKILFEEVLALED